VLLFNAHFVFFSLSQKSETDYKSPLMEKEGLVRAVAWLDSNNINIGTIITDRHRQISKYIRENLSPRGVRHFYDVWHVAKGQSIIHFNIKLGWFYIWRVKEIPLKCLTVLNIILPVIRSEEETHGCWECFWLWRSKGLDPGDC
jgi:hypothetical protein